MAWTATENFESYSNGASLSGASGGSGWNGNWTVGAGTWTASNAQAQGGSTLSGRMSTGSGTGYINRAVTAITSGSLQYYILATATNVSQYLNLSTGTPGPGSNSKILGGFENPNIVFYDNSTQRTLVTNYTANQWYKVTIVFDGVAATYTVQIDSGTVNGPYAYSFGGTAGDITNLQFYNGGGVEFFMDNIGPVGSPGPASVKTFDGVTQSTGIKTYLEVALASVKTVDGIS